MNLRHLLFGPAQPTAEPDDLPELVRQLEAQSIGIAHAAETHEPGLLDQILRRVEQRAAQETPNDSA